MDHHPELMSRELFTRAAFELMRHGREGYREAVQTTPYDEIRSFPRGMAELAMIQRGVATSLSDLGAEQAQLVDGFLGSLAFESALDQLVPLGALPLPRTFGKIEVSGGFSSNVVAEGAPKLLAQLDLNMQDLSIIKTVGMLAMTREVLIAGGPQVQQIFEHELRSAAARGSNAALFAQLAEGATPVASTGDAVGDLAAGLAAAAPSRGYLVMTDQATTNALALSDSTGQLGVTGGLFRPGVGIAPVEDAVGMLVVPTSGIAVWNPGLVIRESDEASVEMIDEPSNSTVPPSAATLVSMFQSNSRLLLAERAFAIAVRDPAGIALVGGDVS
ncbi:hypothetical protein [Halomonas cupida]|uniref:hypothetical protein n=1 Tax=Halomonas cupida TaxID=44933 RepID=UPI003A925936